MQNVFISGQHSFDTKYENKTTMMMMKNIDRIRTMVCNTGQVMVGVMGYDDDDISIRICCFKYDSSSF